MNILVVGGGTAGLVSAMIIRRHLGYTVDVVFSKNIGTIGVGEGSTEHWDGFMEMVGIDQYDLIKHCDATYKGGIMFEGWSERPYLSSVTDSFTSRTGQYPHIYGHQIANNSEDYMNSQTMWDNVIPKGFVNNRGHKPFKQYHFNTHKLNDFLVNHATNMGINFFEDDISEVVMADSGDIEKLVGNSKVYDYDFYIDATGFSKLLISNMGVKWESFNKYLKMNSAVVFQTEEEDSYPLWTLAKAMNAGWLFRIPVWGRMGNGYIFDSNYIDADQAKEEVKALFGDDTKFGKELSFDAGCLDKSWVNNCAAIGLSSMFVEPLEASSIGSSIQQTYALVHKLANYNQDSIDSYNKTYIDIAYNIRDFIALHYITNNRSTPFWEACAKTELPETLKINLRKWKKRLPIREDFSNISDYILFDEYNFIVVMAGLGLFDREEIAKEFYSQSPLTQNFAKEQAQIIRREDVSIGAIPHKKYLSIIRDFL